MNALTVAGLCVNIGQNDIVILITKREHCRLFVCVIYNCKIFGNCFITQSFNKTVCKSVRFAMFGLKL